MFYVVKVEMFYLTGQGNAMQLGINEIMNVSVIPCIDVYILFLSMI